MNTSKLSFKLFLAGPREYHPVEQFVPVLHSFIQMHSIPDHLLIDVADYAHVHNGPGIALISHEANFYLDEFDGEPGLTYQRKQPLPGESFSERAKAALRYALQAATLIESAPGMMGKIAFAKDRLRFRIHDRLDAPNSQATFDAIRSDLQSAVSSVAGAPEVTLERLASNAQLFGVDIAIASAVNSV